MSSVSFVEQENACMPAPSLKMRQRLHSAPENLKSTLIKGKTFSAPLPPSGRKVLGIVTENSTPLVKPWEKKQLKPQQEVKVEAVAQTKLEELPDIEKIHHYDPLEFQKYDIPEEVLLLRGLALHGLASFPPSLHHEESFEPLPAQPLVKMPKHSDNCSELDTLDNIILQIIHELTIDLPPEPLAD